MEKNLKESLINKFESDNESDNKSDNKSDNESNIYISFKNNKKKKKKGKVKLYIESNTGYMKSKYENLKNKNISKFVNIYNTKNDEYFCPEKFRVSYDGFRYLPNSNVYQDNN